MPARPALWGEGFGNDPSYPANQSSYTTRRDTTKSKPQSCSLQPNELTYDTPKHLFAG